MRSTPLALCLALAACAPLDMVEPTPVDRDAVRFDPIASGTAADLTAVWGAGPDDVWFTGWAAQNRWPSEDDLSVLLRWNDGRVALQPSPARGAPEDWRPQALAGSGSGDVWLVGNGTNGPGELPVKHFDGRGWRDAPEPNFAYGQGLAAWVGAADDVWVAGGYGHIWRWDGAEWADLTHECCDNPFFRGRMTGVWAAGRAYAWAVGDAPQADAHVATRWDGVTWHDHPLPGRMVSVWGAGPHDVWAVGWDGAIARWDGRVWVAVESGTDAKLLAVRGDGADRVWAVGEGGTILLWDGVQWALVDSGTDVTLTGLWVGPDAVWVAGHGGTILRHAYAR